MKPPVRLLCLSLALVFSLSAPAGVGGALNRVATWGMDTSVQDFYANTPFNRAICIQRSQFPNSRSAECDKACACHGYAPACLRTATWDKILQYSWYTWWMKYLVDIANGFVKQSQWASSGFEPPAAHLLPPNAWDHVSRGIDVGLCALNLVNSVVLSYGYATGGNCQENYMMAVTGPEIFCHVAFVAASCGEVLRYAGPAYAAYVSSGAQMAVGALAMSCGTGKFLAERMKCVASERACMASVDMGRGVDFRVDEQGRYRPAQCCYCRRQLYEDRWWPRRDRPVGGTEEWGSVVSSAPRDVECEGRPGRKYRVVDPDRRRSLYYSYSGCHRGEPQPNGQCWR